jgi:hypothetical protein
LPSRVIDGQSLFRVLTWTYQTLITKRLNNDQACIAESPGKCSAI